MSAWRRDKNVARGFVASREEQPAYCSETIFNLVVISPTMA